MGQVLRLRKNFQAASVSLFKIAAFKLFKLKIRSRLKALSILKSLSWTALWFCRKSQDADALSRQRLFLILQ